LVFTFYICFCICPDLGPRVGSSSLYQESAALPYWPFSSNDFWSYVEYFRTLGAYNRIDEMARTFFAQFPFGSHLGYHVPNHER
uniref:Otospiralin n=1 Tax=Bubo bubo TaxID=30461 RepID=A0A8C0FJ67_BUBBB